LIGCSMLICAGICGPLWLRGPLAATLIAGAVVMQAVLGAQVSHECKLNRIRERAGKMTLDEFTAEFFPDASREGD